MSPYFSPKPTRMMLTRKVHQRPMAVRQVPCNERTRSRNGFCSGFAIREGLRRWCGRANEILSYGGSAMRAESCSNWKGCSAANAGNLHILHFRSFSGTASLRQLNIERQNVTGRLTADASKSWAENNAVPFESTLPKAQAILGWFSHTGSVLSSCRTR